RPRLGRRRRRDLVGGRGGAQLDDRRPRGGSGEPADRGAGRRDRRARRDGARRGDRRRRAARARPHGGLRPPPRLSAAGLRALGRLVTRRGVRLGLELAGGALAAALLAHPLASAPLEDPITTALPPPAGAPDVILVSLDTTRADHLSTYGYGRETSPHLTAFAADALLFTQAPSPAAWTLPAHASLFTGMYPSRHGAHLAGGFLPGRSIDGHRHVAFPLPEERVTRSEERRVGEGGCAGRSR